MIKVSNLYKSFGNKKVLCGVNLEVKDGETLVQNEATEFCSNTRIRHIALAQNGDLLVNCYTAPAQVRITSDGIINWTTDEGLAGNKTRVSLEAKNGDLYVGTTTGLSVISKTG